MQRNRHICNPNLSTQHVLYFIIFLSSPDTAEKTPRIHAARHSPRIEEQILYSASLLDSHKSMEVSFYATYSFQ